MKVGKPFNWQEEFTSSCDAPLGRGSRLFSNLAIPGAGTLRCADVKGFMQGVEHKTVLIDLSDEQKRMVREITGWAPSKLEISIGPGAPGRDMPLTQQQQHTINEALGIQMAAVSVAREPVEVTLK